VEKIISEITSSISQQATGAAGINESFFNLLHVTEELKDFLTNQSKLNNQIKHQMSALLSQTATIDTTVEALLQGNARVTEESRTVNHISDQNKSVVKELSLLIGRFKLKEIEAQSQPPEDTRITKECEGT
jgi:methyl-accepting chemotaxis protein